MGPLGIIWEHLKKSKRGNYLIVKQLPLLQVPGAGVEPAQPCGHWCLRPTRLPIPPSGLMCAGEHWDAKIRKIIHTSSGKSRFVYICRRWRRYCT